ncbi:nucleotidyltransferase family protein [Pseudocolwellia agarivorans]|uniref:nucleotidyltransferase family protein n=1 Tax=Pseudocolwellia agarivorans TaxID=1911682 RepID=UPI0009870D3E|nr:nucleotidyltransferase family protein [Pseudocolwellia agarivorans]
MSNVTKVAPIKKAILLSAGFGTRLKPITNNIPKCLVPINQTPLLQIWLEQLSKAGFSEFLINTHYLPEQVYQFIEKSPFKDQITTFHEEELLGTLGTLKATKAFWCDSDVLIAHADNLCICDWASFITRFNERKENCLGSLMLFKTDSPQSCGIVELNDTHCVIAFHEKVKNPPSNLANAAVYLFDQRVNTLLSTLTDDETDISYHLMPHLMNKVNGWENKEYMRDIGTPESLAIANNEAFIWLK